MSGIKIVGIVLGLVGIGIFYSAFTASATERFAEWISTYAPSLKDRYSAGEMLMAWGGMLAGISALLICKKR